MCVYSMNRSRFGLPGTFFRLVLGPAVLKLRPLEKSKIQRKVGTPPEWMGVCVYSMNRSRFGLPGTTFRLVLGAAVLKLRPLKKPEISEIFSKVMSSFWARFGLIWAPSPTFWASTVPEI
uniref:Uncharacterized protein n=1 Tax=Cacopsylla melanoneura TaxID=428564 RepID=A0A8D8TDG5_9HEMI